MQIPEATKLPLRAESREGFSTTIIYSLPGKPGLYRRVTRDGRTGLTPGDGNVLAIIPAGTRDGEPTNGLCELVRWMDGECILQPLLPGVEAPDDQKPF